MKKLIMKLLGLNTLVEEFDLLKKQNEEFANRVKHLDDEVNALEEKVDEIEIPDMDDYVASCDLDDNIESYLNNNDYATQCWVEENVQEAVENHVDTESIAKSVLEKVNDDIEERVRDLFNDASPAPMSVEDIKNEVREATKVTLERMVKALADQQ
jgi:predicted nuclease with TOPRIM domain